MMNVLMETFFWGIDRFFIAALLEPEQLAFFHIAHTFGRGVLMFYAAVTFLFYPLLISKFTSLNQQKTNSREVIDTLFKMSRLSETVMILALIFSVLLVPSLISFLLPQYPDLTTLFHVIILGLILKGLLFYPIAYLIAVNLHKLLTYVSLFFILIVACAYWLMGQIFELHAFGYTSLAVVAFLNFLFCMNFITLYKIKTNEIILIVTRFYFKIAISIFISIYFLYVSNISPLISNEYIVLIIIFFLYLNNVIYLLKISYSSFLRRDINYLIKNLI